MLFSLIDNPIMFIGYIIALFVAITVHEFSHALAADRLGDPTPQIQGRVTLNPLAHVDLAGLVFLLFIGFGWGKPVQFDPYNLKNPRKDAAIISIAGPISNFILASLSSILLRLLLFFPDSIFLTIGQIIFIPMIMLNLMLGVFNLLPIHPLDGFKIVGGILSPEKAHEWYGLARYGYIFLIFLIVPFGGRSMLETILNPILNPLFTIFLPKGTLGMF